MLRGSKLNLPIGSLKSRTTTFTVVALAVLTIGLLIRLADELWLVRERLQSPRTTSDLLSNALLHLALLPIYIRLVLASIVSLWGLSSRHIVGFVSCLVGVAYMAFEYHRWSAISQQIYMDERARFLLLAYVKDDAIFSMKNLVVLYLLVCLCLIVLAYRLVRFHTLARHGMKKRCSVYFRGDDIYVISSASTTDGLWIDTEPRLKLMRNDPATDIGQAVITALNGSRQGVPAPVDLRTVGAELIKFAGFKSLSSFERGATYFSVSQTENAISIEPSRRGARGGFDFQPADSVVCKVDALELGMTFIKMAQERQGL